MVEAAPVLPYGYIASTSRIADRRMILAGYRLVDLLIAVNSKLKEINSIQSWHFRLGLKRSLNHPIRPHQHVQRNRQADLLAACSSLALCRLALACE